MRYIVAYKLKNAIFKGGKYPKSSIKNRLLLHHKPQDISIFLHNFAPNS